VSAGPGVLVGTALTALLVKYTFPYNWSWVEALLFGAMFSATDPVAVVAVLKEVGQVTPAMQRCAPFTGTGRWHLTEEHARRVSC
jgi:NhaP-type Na+/H+ or K+/H+ antiporter